MSEKPEDEDGHSLFAEAMRGVMPIKAKQHVLPNGRVLSTRRRQSEADERAVLREMMDDPNPDLLESGDTLLYRAPGIQDGVLRKLRRGQYRIERELDLHGLNRNQAHVAVSEFLAYCKDQDVRCARVIHGKGNGSPNSGPVIKTLLDSWLRKRHQVLAFCSARPMDGGTGAIYLLLRSGGS